MIIKANIPLLIWFMFILTEIRVKGQVCVETVTQYRDVPETYLYTYMETYERSDSLFCSLFRCTDTRVATAIGTRLVRKLMAEKINVCCEGYVEDDNDNRTSIHCEPYCSPTCINGYCKTPGVCACNPGYLTDMFDSHSCSPLCVKGCDHGRCLSPNTCQCDLGYDLVKGVCEPTCSEPCQNGTCIAPETCQCLSGYKKSENDICEPFCSSYTVSGDCINSISCEPGWIRVIKGLVETCEPECSEPCYNGTCIAPDTCECLNGYEKSDNTTCEPHCSLGCDHGSCVTPQTCICDPGWYKKDFSGTCIAHCDQNCGNGTCVGPNICDCFTGYELKHSEFLEDAVCVPICEQCEGSCIAPGVCSCDPYQEMIFVKADGSPCNCVDNCIEECNRTLCVMTTTTASVGEFNKIDVLEDPTTISAIGLYVDSTTEIYYSDLDELNVEKASWNNSSWFYIIGSALILMIIISTISVVLKRKYFKSWNRNIFNSRDCDVTTAVHYKQNPV